MLQDYTKHQKQISKQATEHTSNVVVALQSKLADTSMNFKDVLEIRTEVWVLFTCVRCLSVIYALIPR